MLNPELYEINILVNRKTGSVADRSVQVIDEFIANFEREHGFTPSVHYHDIEIDPPYNNVGYARKLLTDAVVLRSLNRPNQNAPLYFETEDADMVDIDKRTVANLIEKLDQNPHLDAVRGKQDRTPKFMKDNDYLFLRRRAWDFFEIGVRSKKFRNPKHPNWNFTWNRIVTGGWNTGYTAESYALIGGYEVVEAGEDMSIGEKITMIRGDGSTPNLEVVGTVSTRSNSSPRRFIHEILTDRAAYDNFSDEEANRLIRETTTEEALQSIGKYGRIDDSNQEVFSNYINNILNWTRSSTPTHTDSIQLTKRILFFLGFKKEDYRIIDNHIEVVSWDNVKRSLEEYRQRYDSGEFREAITG